MQKENAKSAKHANRDIKYVCFNNNCSQIPRSCIICLKNDHPKCPENLILSYEKANFKSIQLDNRYKISEIKQTFEDNMTRASREFAKFYNDALERLISDPSLSEANQYKLSLADILQNKDDYQLQYNETKKKIEVTKASIPPEEVPEFIKELDSKLKELIDDYFDRCMRIRFLGKIKIIAEEFTHHSALTLVDEGIGMRLSQPTDGNSYYLCIAKKPLDYSIKLRMTVDNIYASDRYVEVGLMTQSEVATYSESLIGKFVLGSPSYGGYSKRDMDGVMPTTSMSSELGLINGCSFCFEYDAATKKVKVFDDRNLDLTGKAKEEAYLYFCIYFTNQTVLIEPYD